MLRVPLAPAIVSLVTTAIGCASAAPPSAPRAQAVMPAPRASTAGKGARYQMSEVITYRGACDASGAAGLEGGLVAVGDDEDNRLRIYDAARGGLPVEIVDARRHLVGPDGVDAEMDLEGAATIGTRIYWIASHARKKSGKPAPSRLKLFASDIQGADGGRRLALVGRPYSHLLEDMIQEPALRRYDLASAAARSPIAPGGLNIEGLTETEEGHLLLGFRNPVPGGRALVVRITNPKEIVERLERPRFGGPTELNLEGRGIRTISSGNGAYWMVGGSVADPTVPSRLYRWDGFGAPVWIDSIELGDLNIEAIATVALDGGHTRLLLISDDGTRHIAGKRCKKLRDPSAKQFRAVWLIVSPA